MDSKNTLAIPKLIQSSSNQTVVSYELEMLNNMPRFSFSLDWEETFAQKRMEFEKSSPYWIDCSIQECKLKNSIITSNTSSLQCSQSDIIQSETFRDSSVGCCVWNWIQNEMQNTCIHIFNFPENISAEQLFWKCSSIGVVNDIVILTRFPYTYGYHCIWSCYIGRIECSSNEALEDLYNHLNNPIMLSWIVSW